MGVKKESKFQYELIRQLELIFPGCIVFKNDPTYIQGFPDLTILWNNKWAVLECKRSEKDLLKSLRSNPNQAYYVELLNTMSFSSFIFPENMEDVLYELQQAFGI